VARKKRRFLDELGGRLKKGERMPPRTEKFLADLKMFCDQKHGRRAQLARFLGMPRQTVTDLLNGRQKPTGEQVLAIQEWLGGEREKNQ
jgi:plasmid maintenance system antidote protein VapI